MDEKQAAQQQRPQQQQQEQLQQERQQEQLERRQWLWRELWLQWRIAGPMICVNLLQFLVQLTAVMFVGHLGELSLASASLATAFCVVTGFSVMLGLASALETLCGQAYGAKQYNLLGIYLQRAVIVLNLASVPVAFIWYFMDPILRSLGQDPDVAASAGEYARWLIPGLFGYASLQALVKYLQAQSAVYAMAFSSLASLLLHLGLSWLLVYKLQLGARGAPLSAGVAYWTNTIALALYIARSKRFDRTWGGFSKQAFADFRGFFNLAIPSAVMICLQYWSFEALTLLSGLLPNPQLETSTFSTLLNTVTLLYMIPYGLSAAVSTRVSNELGAGNAAAAKAAACVTLSIGLLDSIVIVTLLNAARHIVGWAFSSDKEVVDYVAELLPFASFISFADPIQGVLTGVARGCGWQGIGALANLGAYYVVGIPIGAVLAFVFKLKTKGLWLGIICGMSTQSTTLLLITFLTNWQQQAENAWKRVVTASEKLEQQQPLLA